MSCLTALCYCICRAAEKEACRYGDTPFALFSAAEEGNCNNKIQQSNLSLTPQKGERKRGENVSLGSGSFYCSRFMAPWYKARPCVSGRLWWSRASLELFRIGPNWALGLGRTFGTPYNARCLLPWREMEHPGVQSVIKTYPTVALTRAMKI